MTPVTPAPPASYALLGVYCRAPMEFLRGARVELFDADARAERVFVDGVSGHRTRKRALEAAGLNAHAGRAQEQRTYAGHECGMETRLQVDGSPRLSERERHGPRTNQAAALGGTSGVGA